MLACMCFSPSSQQFELPGRTAANTEPGAGLDFVTDRRGPGQVVRRGSDERLCGGPLGSMGRMGSLLHTMPHTSTVGMYGTRVKDFKQEHD